MQLRNALRTLLTFNDQVLRSESEAWTALVARLGHPLTVAGDSDWPDGTPRD
jgi:hypothetical protein